MTTVNNYSLSRNKTLKISDLLVWCFAAWPLFWNIWGVLKLTANIGVSFPMYFLWGITVFMILAYKNFSGSFLITWFFFLGTVALESILRPMTVISDLSVILCGIIFCMLMYNREIDYQRIIKCLTVCGLIISASVVIDSTTGLFRNSLINIYTYQAQTVKYRMASSGGLLPHTGSAGCFIYSGLAAYTAQTRIKGKKLNSIFSWIVILLFVTSALLIQKRGFIIDTAITVFLIKVLEIKKEEIKTDGFQKKVKVFFSFIGGLLVAVIMYNYVPLIHDSYDSLIERFTSSDETYSGRTNLYDLAFSLYQGHELTGIGWGRYRLYSIGIFGDSSASYAVHNVYLQLLCETGILGLSAFLIAAAVSLWYAMKKYRKLNIENSVCEERYVVQLGLMIQMFFLAYCMSGNPLYDYNFCITYFIGVMLTVIPIRNGNVIK